MAACYTLSFNSTSWKSLQNSSQSSATSFFTAAYYSTIWPYCSLFSCSPKYGHLGSFQGLALTNDVAMHK